MLTTSLQLSKKLKEAGREKQARFYYQKWELVYYRRGKTIPMYEDTYPGVTAQELLDDLPIQCENGELEVYKLDEKEYQAWYCIDGFCDEHFVEESTAEALGNLRLRCKENGLFDKKTS